MRGYQGINPERPRKSGYHGFTLRYIKIQKGYHERFF